jgi:hypothetical protein
MARIALALALLALTAQPAYAGRAYGVLVPGQSLLTFEVDGNTLRAAAARLTLFCDDGDSFAFAANFKIGRPTRHDEEFLVPRRSRPGTLRHWIVADWGRGRDRIVLRGRLTVTRLQARKPRVHLFLRASDRIGDCVGELTRLARREPGVLYTGGTDDDEPVWLRRLPDGVEWVAGYGAACRPFGFMEGFHEDFVPLTGANTFGRGGLIGGFQSGDYEQSVALGGTFAPAAATGTQRLVGTERDNRCDTKERRWRAVTG